MARIVNIALLQSAAGEEPEANLARAVRQIEAAAAQGAAIVCTGELFRSRYFCQREDHANFALAEPIPGPTSAAMAAAAKRLGVVIVASLFERRAAGMYHNTAVVFDADGSTAGMYRKMHIPDDPLYYEKFYFTPGDLGFRAFTTQVARIGVLVCWDQWFPEAARLVALDGAEILFYPTAIGWHPAEKKEWGERQFQSWQTIQRGHAIANGMYVAVPNRVGFEASAGSDGLEFWGGSFVADPSGRLLAEAPHEGETILTAACDLEAVEQARVHWPFLRDRRVDAYGDLLKRLRD